MNAEIAWLMEGDPAIRWQTMRDLLDLPAGEWQAEQQRTLTTGWGADFLARQDPDGRWGQGLYSPKWISTTYTLLSLRGIGIPPGSLAAQSGAAQLIDGLLGKALDDDFRARLARLDRCIVGMLLELCSYFQVVDTRLATVAQNLLDERMPDGAWNCRKGRDRDVCHSSVHTTINVLEGIRDYLDFVDNPASRRQRPALEEAEKSALEFLLQHRLFRSSTTNEVIKPAFAEICYPPRYFYDYLRALDYFARIQFPYDPRLQDGIDLLHLQQRKDGRWPLGKRHSGLDYFTMEKGPGAARWNTLRALRVLKWWKAVTAPLTKEHAHA